MDGLRDELLARAGLAGDEDRQLGGGGLAEALEHAAHDRARADERSELGDVGDLDLLGVRRVELEARVAEDEYRRLEEVDLADARIAEVGAVA